MGYLNEDGLATLVGKVKGQVVQLTAAEYRQIPAETKNTDNKIYFVEDDDYAYAIDNEPTLNSENLVKSGGVYNYTSKIGTGALTTTAQTLIPAVNELKADIATLSTALTSVEEQLISTVNITSVTWNSTYVKSGSGKVFKTGRIVHVMCLVVQGTPDQTVVCSGLPASAIVSSGSAFWMNNVDDAKGLTCYINGSSLQFRAHTAVEGSGGVVLTISYISNS